MSRQLTRIIVSFDKAVMPEGMAGNNDIKMEFMKCVGSGGLGSVYKEIPDAPFSWHGEIFEGLEDIPARLHTWWQKYALNCEVRELGEVEFPHTNDTAFRFYIEPAQLKK